MNKDKFCFSKTLTYLVLLVVAVAGFFYITNYYSQQKLTQQSQARVPASSDDEICKKKTGDKTASCVTQLLKNLPNDGGAICGNNRKRPTGISIDGANTSLYSFDCNIYNNSINNTHNTYTFNKRCCIDSRYNIPTLTPIPTKTPTPAPTLRPPRATPTFTANEQVSAIAKLDADAFCSKVQSVFKNKYGTEYYSAKKSSSSPVQCYKVATTGNVILGDGSTCFYKSCYKCVDTVVTGGDVTNCNYSKLEAKYPYDIVGKTGNVLEKEGARMSAYFESKGKYPSTNNLGYYYKVYSTSFSGYKPKGQANSCYLVNGELRNYSVFSSQSQTLTTAPTFGQYVNKIVHPAYCMCAQGSAAACGLVLPSIGKGIYDAQTLN